MILVDAFAPIRHFDAETLRLAHEIFHAPTFVRPMRWLAGPYAPVLFVPLALIWIARGSWRATRIMLATLAGLALTTTLTTYVLHPLIARPSPSLASLSFPSSATANAFFLASFLSLYYLGSGSWTIVLALAVGISCVVAGDAHPSDVIAGAALGVTLGILGWNLTRNNIGRRQSVWASGNLDAAQSRRMSRR